MIGQDRREGAVAERGRPPPLTEDDVLEALTGVIDPELDENIVELDFVTRVVVDGGRVRVDLRLPTYWCAPNFSWLMASDTRAALVDRPGVEEVEVVLADHHASEEISKGVSAGRSFDEVFADDADEGGLEPLRTLFRRKAFLVRQEKLLRTLESGVELSRLTLGDLPDSEEAGRYVDIRRELALDCSSTAPVVTDPAGRPALDPADHRRRARMARVSIESNNAWCRGLLATRYPERPETRGGDEG